MGRLTTSTQKFRKQKTFPTSILSEKFGEQLVYPDQRQQECWLKPDRLKKEPGLLLKDKPFL
jgi:hypothetical protein